MGISPNFQRHPNIFDNSRRCCDHSRKALPFLLNHWKESINWTRRKNIRNLEPRCTKNKHVSTSIYNIQNSFIFYTLKPNTDYGGRSIIYNITILQQLFSSSFKSYLETLDGHYNLPRGNRDGAVVRAPTSHQCGLSLLLVLVLAPRGFSPGTPVFPSPQKPTFPNSNSIWIIVKHFLTSLWLGRLRKHFPCYWH